MKKVLFGLLGVVSMAGLVACGDPANSAGELSESPETEATMDTEVDQMAPEEMAPEELPVDGTTPMELPDVSDSDIEMTIQDSLTTLYPDSQFEVESEAGNVTIAGDITSPEEAEYIAEWVTEIEGVTSVDVLAPEDEQLP
jgi:osmotically-inducible protein OsmY